MKLKLLLLTFIAVATGAANAQPVEMMLTDRLDGNLDSYCLDISGSKKRADISKGLQTHTCYSYQGAMGVDQTFDSARLAEEQLYMPEFDVCVTVSELKSGASVGLSTCDNTDQQAISMTSNGQLSPVNAPELCFTAGSETRLGRGGTSKHQIKSLSLQLCSEDLAKYQHWELRG